MNLIHRHIFASVAVTCASAVGLFGFLLIVANALKDLLGYVLAGQLPVDRLLYLIALSVPSVCLYALPVGMLTGILLVLGRMSSDREITALRSAGLSVAWVSAPILFLALLGVVAGLFINFEYMPRARMAYQRVLADAISQNPLSFIEERKFITDFPGVVLYVGEKRQNQLKDFWLWELDAQNRVKRFARADSGRLTYDAAENKMVLLLDHALAEQRENVDPEDYSKEQKSAAWEQATFDLPLDKLTGGRVVQQKDKWLTFPQLMAKWMKLRQPNPELAPQDREKQLMRVQITIQDKCASAFSVLSFALIAVPLGIKVSRKETSANLGVGLLLFFGYYFAGIMVGWLDGVPSLRPDLLVWLPNVCFQGLGFWLFYKIDRA